MHKVLCFNPGSNSLKFDVIDVSTTAARAGEGKRVLTGTIDNIGRETSLELSRGKEKILSKRMQVKDFSSAAQASLDALAESEGASSSASPQVAIVAVRVVHGGSVFDKAVRFDDGVRKQIEKREKLAPLHNANSLRIIDAVQRRCASLPIVVAFDTAFHQTLPERAWRYPLPKELADRHSIRKYGFHGLSHRYQMEQYAHLVGTPVADVTIITTHLESGASVTAIRKGRSIDTSMGFTPLEGLMMGTRSGSIDPAILPFLMHSEGLSAEGALEILEKKSGLLGISQVSLDTRILRKRDDPDSRLALEMFGYRVRQVVGAYLAVLGRAEALIFGGGIGENTPEVREMVCAGLCGWGVALDENLNQTTMHGDVKLSTAQSTIAVWAIHSDEALQLAYECVKVLH